MPQDSFYFVDKLINHEIMSNISYVTEEGLKKMKDELIAGAGDNAK